MTSAGTAAYRTPDRLRARIGFHERYPSGAGDFHDWLLAHVDAPPDAAVLEVGAGTARMWARDPGRVPPGWRLTLTDLSAGMVEAAAEAVADAGISARVLQADVTALPFEPASFDLAFANHMLYHVSDLDRAVAELRRVLAPGGALIAATNGEAHLAGLRELAAEPGRWEGAGVVAEGVAPLPFTLESGGEALARSFSHVSVHRRDDVVFADDAEVVLAYLRSMLYLPPEPSDELLAELAGWEERVRLRLAARPLEVRRSSGFFVAR